MADAGSIHMSVGIKTIHGKYFNVEKFNFQLSSNATSVRQKQTFQVEFEDGVYYFRSWLKTYLSAHELGEVSCKTPVELRGPKEAFQVEYKDGFISLKSVHSGKYLSADENTIVCKAAAPSSPSERFELISNIHPAVSVRTSEGRFLRVDDKGDDIYADRDSQFGHTLFTLEYEGEGKYAIRADSGRYFTADAAGLLGASGKAKGGPAQSFHLEFNGKKLAIKAAVNGKYLTTEGAKGNLRAKKEAPAARELFDLVKCDPQVAVKAHNGKYATCQGINISCNRPAIGLEEAYILEQDGDRYALKNTQGKYWTVKDAALVADAAARGQNELFVLEYTPTGKTYFKGGTAGKYISAKSLGGVRMAPENDEQEQFDMYLLNRPIVALRSKLLSYIGTSGDKFTANKNASETLRLEQVEGQYFLANADGIYLSVEDDKVHAVAGKKEPLMVELCKGKIAFKTQAQRYLQADNNGNLLHGGKARGESELFEF